MRALVATGRRQERRPGSISSERRASTPGILSWHADRPICRSVRGCRRGLGGLVILMWGCTGPNPAFSPAPMLDGSTGSGGAGGQPVREAGADSATGGSGGGEASDGPAGDIAFEVAAGEVMDAPVDIVSPLDTADLPADSSPDRAPDLPADLPSDLLVDGPVPVGTGLRGQYFDGNAAGDRGHRRAGDDRNDEAIDFDWGTGPPGVGTSTSTGSRVRWTGKVMPRFSETYTFRTVTRRGRAPVGRRPADHRQVDDELRRFPRPAPSPCRRTPSTRSRWSTSSDTGRRSARLYWMSSSQPLQIIPRANLFLPTP